MLLPSQFVHAKEEHFDSETNGRIIVSKNFDYSKKNIAIIAEWWFSSEHVLFQQVLAQELMANKLCDNKHNKDIYCKFYLLRSSEGFKCLWDQFERDVKPHLPWKKIGAILQALPREMKIKNMEWVVFILMPFPIEHMIEEDDKTIIRVDESELDRTFEKRYGYRLTTGWGQIIKMRSGLKGQLEKLQAKIMTFDGYTPIYWKQYEPLTLVIRELDREIGQFKAAKEKLQKRNTVRKQLYSFDTNSSKSPKKQSYWNNVIPPALTVLNRLCHTDNCRKTCRMTHKKAYEKTAEILKILYPSIWSDDIKTIASQIKAREQRTA